MPGLYALRPLASASKAATGKQQKQDQRSPCSRYPFKSRRSQVSSTHHSKHTQASSQFIRPKKVTDPLAETVTAQIYGAVAAAQVSKANCLRSGNDQEPSSSFLAAQVREFNEDEAKIGTCGRVDCNCVGDPCDQEGNRDEYDEDHANVGSEQFLEIVEEATSHRSTTELLLLGDVTKAIEAVKEKPQQICERECVSCLSRFVMSYLRRAGYDAAICKSAWDHSGSLPAGNYEYIDIILDMKDGKNERQVLDMDFKTQFEIARATTLYSTYLNLLPTIFLGRPERLQVLLKFMSKAVKCSLKRKGLHLPPWRKLSYLQAKWFSSYTRITTGDRNNHIPSPEALQRDASTIRVKTSQFHFRSTNELGKMPPKLEVVRREGREAMLARKSNVVAADNIREMIRVNKSEWQLPTIKPRREKRGQMVSGIAGALKVCRLEKVHGGATVASKSSI